MCQSLRVSPGSSLPHFLLCLLSSGAKQNVLVKNSFVRNKTKQNLKIVLVKVSLLWERAGKVLKTILYIKNLQDYKYKKNIQVLKNLGIYDSRKETWLTTIFCIGMLITLPSFSDFATLYDLLLIPWYAPTSVNVPTFRPPVRLKMARLLWL